MNVFRFAHLTVLCLSMLLLSCSRVNHDNYRKLEVGMEYDRVVEILGQPAQCDSVLNAKDCTWGTQKRSIDIQFVADKVVFFSSNGI